MFFSDSEPDTKLVSVPGSSLTRKAPAYGACHLRLSCKVANNLGSCMQGIKCIREPTVPTSNYLFYQKVDTITYWSEKTFSYASENLQLSCMNNATTAP